jgi:hypothetical protein
VGPTSQSLVGTKCVLNYVNRTSVKLFANHSWLRKLKNVSSDIHTSQVSGVPGGRRAKAVQGMPENNSVVQRENFLPNLFMDKHVAT